MQKFSKNPNFRQFFGITSWAKLQTGICILALSGFVQIMKLHLYFDLSYIP